ncbi:MAG: glycosyltransferase family 1 protein [Ferruginibacter sp.]
MDLVCFSHLHWDFVYQRPQHILSRFTTQYRVFYIQEFSFTDIADGYSIDQSNEQVWIIKPHLRNDHHDNILERQRKILNELFVAENISSYILWYYTPMSLLFSDHLRPVVTIYDCMDELSAFKFADPNLKDAERALFQKADVVFTGGNSLFEAKKNQHDNVHAFPSSIDKDHFAIARQTLDEYADQLNIPHPRLGFFGVIDERFDIGIIEQAATLKPDWHFILIGPVVKIDPASLPKNNNIHYLGSKTYKELPVYLSGWDIALIPFAINESTKFISPTKTPEYLAAGKPVISTPITDVIYPYGTKELVHIINNASELVEKATLELDNTKNKEWLKRVDEHLVSNSWDITWFHMYQLIKKEIYNKQHSRTEKIEAYV